jgi:serine/threonine-protein kinase
MGQPFVLEGARSISCGFIDDDPADNQGMVEVRVEEIDSTRHTDAELHRLVAEMTMLVKQRRYKEALELGKKCVQLAPTHAECYLRLGAVQAHTGNLSEGAENYRRFVELSPDHLMAGKVQEMLEAYDKRR